MHIIMDNHAVMMNQTKLPALYIQIVQVIRLLERIMQQMFNCAKSIRQILNYVLTQVDPLALHSVVMI